MGHPAVKRGESDSVDNPQLKLVQTPQDQSNWGNTCANLSRNKGLLQTVLTFYQGFRWKLLQSEIASIMPEIECRARQSNCEFDWIDLAREQIQCAQQALSLGQIDRGWRSLHAAQRLSLFAYSDEELLIKAKVILAEAPKLKPWRQKAIHAILGDCKKPTVHQVYEAVGIRNDHYCNEAFKLSLMRHYLGDLSKTLALVFSLGLMIKMFGQLFIDYGGPASVLFYGKIVIFGLLGGVISAMTKARSDTRTSSIPQMVASSRVTFLRISVGAGFAIAITFLVKSGLMGGLFSDNLANVIHGASNYGIYLLAFVAGYSERFALKAINVIASEKKMQENERKSEQAA